MVQVVECPNCAQQLRVPRGLDSAQLVRCPICDAEYPLSETAAEVQEIPAEEAPAEELVPVASDGAGAESEATNRNGDDSAAVLAERTPEIEPAESAQVDQAEHEPTQMPENAATEQEPAGPTEPAVSVSEQPADATGEEDLRQRERGNGHSAEQQPATSEVGEAHPAEQPSETVAQRRESEQRADVADIDLECPHCGRQFPISEAVLIASGEKLGKHSAEVVAQALSEQTADAGGERLSFGPQVTEVPHIDTGQTPDAVDEEAIRFAASLAAEQPEQESVTARIAPRGKSKSLIKAACGPVLGGLAGLVIAYYILVLIRGDAGNFLKIPVLGIPHTYKYSPEWFPSWLRVEADQEDQQGGEQSEANQDDLGRLFRFRLGPESLERMTFGAPPSGHLCIASIAERSIASRALEGHDGIAYLPTALITRALGLLHEPALARPRDDGASDLFDC